MNVTFRLPNEDLEKKLISEAGANGFSGLKGHRSVGGLRASIYNAFPKKGVEDLIPWKKAGLLAVEMEGASLYLTAQSAQVEALCLLTISDLPFSGGELSSEERELSLTQMIELGLDVACMK